MSFEDCLKSLRRTATENAALCTSGMVEFSIQAGDCYAGQRSQEATEFSRLQKQIKQLDAVNRGGGRGRGLGRGGRGSNKGTGRGGRGGFTGQNPSNQKTVLPALQRKLQMTCEGYNSAQGCNVQNCTKRHLCNKVN